MDQTHRCLIVEDDSIILSFLVSLVSGWGVEVCGTAASALEAVSIAREQRPTVILMDVRLIGERDGVDAAIEIHRFSTPRTVYLTASREASTVRRIEADHPDHILFKPVNPAALREAICGAA